MPFVVCKETDLHRCSLIPMKSSAKKLLAGQKLVKVKFKSFFYILSRQSFWLYLLKDLARQRVDHPSRKTSCVFKNPENARMVEGFLLR
jgi:hypothetical protein